MSLVPWQERRPLANVVVRPWSRAGRTKINNAQTPRVLAPTKIITGPIYRSFRSTGFRTFLSCSLPLHTHTRADGFIHSGDKTRIDLVTGVPHTLHGRAYYNVRCTRNIKIYRSTFLSKRNGFQTFPNQYRRDMLSAAALNITIVITAMYRLVNGTAERKKKWF